MKNFVKALYADLLHRIDLVIDEIDRMEHHEDYRTRFIESTLQKIYEIRKPIQQALEIGGLEYDTLAGNYLFQYNRLNREFNAYHSYRFLAIKNYGKPEQFFYRLITKIYKEHRITSLPPIVSTISNHDYYYWAVPMLEIIAIPSGEENSLLNLPDMYHEIGHLLYSMYKGRSCELSGIAIDKHFKKEIASLHDKRQYEHFGATVSRARDLWQASWLEEFSCDLAGTYMTGAAYAWTNLKLISADHGSSKIFDYNDTHPANEARMRIIILMLEKLGLTEEKKRIEQTWEVFLRDAEIFRPPAYKLIFPDKLLNLIIDEFFNFYDNADLAKCTDLDNAQEKSIAQLLNEAWDQAQTAPAQFNIYETSSITELYTRFGIER